MNDHHRIRVVFLHAAFPEILRTGVLHLHALETVEMTNPIEQQARELKPCPFCGGKATRNANITAFSTVYCSDCAAETGYFDSAESAVTAWNRRALTPTGENAKHVEVLRGILDEYVTEEQRYGWTLERDALQAAMRALSAPDNAEGNGWPDYVLLRDTKLQDNNGGLGQRIFTTAGAGYEKVKYIRADLANPTPAARVSEEDLMLCEHAARTCEENDLLFRAAAIRRLVQAVKGEK